MKITKQSTTFRLDEITKLRIKEMAKYLQHSEAEIITYLVDAYYKNKVTKKGFHGFYGDEVEVTAKQIKSWNSPTEKQSE